MKKYFLPLPIILRLPIQKHLNRKRIPKYLFSAMTSWKRNETFISAAALLNGWCNLRLSETLNKSILKNN